MNTSELAGPSLGTMVTHLGSPVFDLLFCLHPPLEVELLLLDVRLPRTLLRGNQEVWQMPEDGEHVQ